MHSVAPSLCTCLCILYEVHTEGARHDQWRLPVMPECLEYPTPTSAFPDRRFMNSRASSRPGNGKEPLVGFWAASFDGGFPAADNGLGAAELNTTSLANATRSSPAPHHQQALRRLF